MRCDKPRSVKTAASKYPDRIRNEEYSSDVSIQASVIRSMMSGDSSGARALPVFR